MLEKRNHLDYQTALRLFESWLTTSAGAGCDTPDVHKQIKDLEQKLARPQTVVFTGPDTSLVRRFSALVSGDEDQLADLQGDDFRPILLTEHEEELALLRWWDRSDQEPFDQSPQVAQKKMADLINIKGKFGLPAQMSVMDMSGTDKAAPQLVKFTLSRLCDILVFVCSPDDWLTLSKSRVWKAVPGAIRKNAVVVLVSDADTEFASLKGTNDKIALVAKRVVNLTSSEIALETSDLLRWADAQAKYVFEALNAMVSERVEEATTKIAPQLDQLLARHTSDYFWDVATEKAEKARARAIEEEDNAILARAARISRETVPVAVTDQRPEKKDSPAVPLPEPPKNLDAPKTAEPRAKAAEPAAAEEAEKSIADIWLEGLKDAHAKGDGLARADVKALLVSLAYDLKQKVVSREMAADCDATLEIIKEMEMASDEDADMAFGSIIYQLASSISTARGLTTRALPPGAGKAWQEPVRA
ncbi:hypothetical protein [Aliiroseovarius sp. 2305UL8-7]|uniref:hypothetical protein n=1 Tax=Aliiroseovarius conchicola TaxID=3121637 RepID=UPI0035277F12